MRINTLSVILALLPTLTLSVPLNDPLFSCPKESRPFLACLQKIVHRNTSLDSLNDIRPKSYPNGYMSRSKSAVLWLKTRNPTTGKYEIPLRLDPHLKYAQEDRERLVWVLKNLERGSNLQFVLLGGLNEPSKPHIYITDRQPGACNSHLGMFEEDDVRTTVNLPASPCSTKYTTTHELFHALGFEHEHQRSDAHLYVKMDPEAIKQGVQLQPDPDVETSTPYDMASMMHYDNYIEPIEIRYYDSVHSRSITPTSCDWAALNTAYPGKKLPPKCIPHLVPDACTVLSSCPFGRNCFDVCRYYCGHDGEFYGKYCEIKEGRRFPVDAMTPQEDQH